MQQFLIIGSGLIGRLLAWRLIRQGHQVDILSRDDVEGTDSAGYVAASMVSPLTEAVYTEVMVKEMGLVSYQLWPQWLSELPENVDYQDHGTLVVAHAGDQAEMTRFKRRAEHVLEQADFTRLDNAALKQCAPDLAKNFDDALFFEHESCIDNRQLYRVLKNVLTTSPLCRWRQIDSVATLSEHVIDVLSHYHFGHSASRYTATIDCRGNGAQQDIDQLRGVRGEVIRVHAPDVDIKHAVRLLHPRYPLYLAPRANQEYVLGATVIESDDMSPVSVRSGLELLSALYSLHAGFSEARILEMSAHCRPATVDNMPMIKRTSWGFHVNGFYRHGYLFSPAIITDLVHVLNDGDAAQLKFGSYFNV
jgi:glycine oxidase